MSAILQKCERHVFRVDINPPVTGAGNIGLLNVHYHLTSDSEAVMSIIERESGALANARGTQLECMGGAAEGAGTGEGPSEPAAERSDGGTARG